MQNKAIKTVAKSLPPNKVILLNCLISNSYIPYTDLRKICVKAIRFQHINTKWRRNDKTEREFSWLRNMCIKINHLTL